MQSSSPNGQKDIYVNIFFKRGIIFYECDETKQKLNIDFITRWMECRLRPTIHVGEGWHFSDSNSFLRCYAICGHNEKTAVIIDWFDETSSGEKWLLAHIPQTQLNQA